MVCRDSARDDLPPNKQASNLARPIPSFGQENGYLGRVGRVDTKARYVSTAPFLSLCPQPQDSGMQWDGLGGPMGRLSGMQCVLVSTHDQPA